MVAPVGGNLFRKQWPVATPMVRLLHYPPLITVVAWPDLPKRMGPTFHERKKMRVAAKRGSEATRAHTPSPQQDMDGCQRGNGSGC